MKKIELKDYQPRDYQEKLDAFADKLNRKVKEYLDGLTDEHVRTYGQAKKNKSQAEAVIRKLGEKNYTWRSLLTFLSDIWKECESGAKGHKKYGEQNDPKLVNTSGGNGWWDKGFTAVYLKEVTETISGIDEINCLRDLIGDFVVDGSNTYNSLRNQQDDVVERTLNEHSSKVQVLTTDLQGSKEGQAAAKKAVEDAKKRQQALQLELVKLSSIQEELERVRQENEQLKKDKEQLTQDKSELAAQVSGLQAKVEGKDALVQSKQEEIVRQKETHSKSLKVLEGATNQMKVTTQALVLWNEKQDVKEHKEGGQQQPQQPPAQQQRVDYSKVDWCAKLIELGVSKTRVSLLTALVNRYVNEQEDSTDRPLLYGAIKSLMISHLAILKAYGWNDADHLEYTPDEDDTGYVERNKSDVAKNSLFFIGFGCSNGAADSTPYRTLAKQLNDDPEVKPLISTSK